MPVIIVEIKSHITAHFGPDAFSHLIDDSQDTIFLKNTLKINKITTLNISRNKRLF